MSINRRDFIKLSAGASVSLSTVLSALGQEPSIKKHMSKIKITSNGTQPSFKGPADWFTGDVIVDMLFQPEEPARAGGANVVFAPGARTAWHTHPLGQTIIITAGLGWVQEEGGPIKEVRAGDVVWFPPEVKHWHGASPKTSMSHIAIQEAKDGEVVTWMEHVSDEQYSK